MVLIAGGRGEGRGQYGVFSRTPRNMAEYLQKYGRARLIFFVLLWACHWNGVPAGDAFCRHVLEWLKLANGRPVFTQWCLVHVTFMRLQSSVDRVQTRDDELFPGRILNVVEAAHRPKLTL